MGWHKTQVPQCVFKGKDGDRICPGRRYTTCWDSASGPRKRRPKLRENRVPSTPPPPGGGGVAEALHRLAVEVASMPGVKLHRREMVRKKVVGMGEAMMHLEGGDEGLRALTGVLTKVRDGGDLDEEDNGYYSSSEDEGEVTAEMAARGVGEAGRVVVADTIWNKLVPPDLARGGGGGCKTLQRIGGHSSSAEAIFLLPAALHYNFAAQAPAWREFTRCARTASGISTTSPGNL